MDNRGQSFRLTVGAALMAALLFGVGCTSSPASSPEPLEIPEWARGAVWYQIFPERFRNGDPTNDPTVRDLEVTDIEGWQVTPWSWNWYALQDWQRARSDNFYDTVFHRRYGGDIQGVIDQLDYLEELGIDAIYFNPVFDGRSLHKYDATTYHHIDHNFGPDPEGDLRAILNETEDPATWTWTAADSLFLRLIQEAHARGIRIVIDGVFNHSGRNFWAFRDLIEKQQQSRYKDWFVVTRWDDPSTPENEFDYEAWWGFKSLPVFREDDNGLVEGPREYIFNITRRWMDPNGDGNPEDGIDGWRLDVAQDVAPPFWEEWSRLVKSINPQAYTSGEIWQEAGEWIGRRFDAVMNYPVAKAMVQFFINQERRISVTEFDRELARIRGLYPEPSNHLLMNLIDSHDTDRVGSMIRNPDRNYDRQAGLRDNPRYDPRKPEPQHRRVQQLIAIFQMTYIGAPMIYYGDEAGMWGGDDPDDRKPMVWPDLRYDPETYTTVRPDLADVDSVAFDGAMFGHYQRLIELRKLNPALRYGDFVSLLTDDENEVYAFARRFQGQEVVVVLNNSSRDRTVEVPLADLKSGHWDDRLNGGSVAAKEGTIHVGIPHMWGRIFVGRP
jgi:glycosidase